MDPSPEGAREKTVCIAAVDLKKLTFRYAGRDFRLTDVHGTVIKDLVA